MEISGDLGGQEENFDQEVGLGNTMDEAEPDLEEEEEEEYSIEDMLGLDVAAAHKPKDKSSRSWYLRPHAILCETRIWYFAFALALVAELHLDVAPFTYDSWVAAFASHDLEEYGENPPVWMPSPLASFVD